LNSPNQPPNQPLSAEQIEVRIWAFVVVSVTLILSFIVVALLYSVTFVTQPIKAMAPIDQAYTKMLNDIVLLIVGGIGGIMGKRAVSSVAQVLEKKETPNE
jgi:predicted permease